MLSILFIARENVHSNRQRSAAAFCFARPVLSRASHFFAAHNSEFVHEMNEWVACSSLFIALHFVSAALNDVSIPDSIPTDPVSMAKKFPSMTLSCTSDKRDKNKSVLSTPYGLHR